MPFMGFQESVNSSGVVSGVLVQSDTVSFVVAQSPCVTDVSEKAGGVDSCVTANEPCVGLSTVHPAGLAMMPVANQKRSILDSPRQLDLDLSRTDRCRVCVDCVAGDCDAETKRETEARKRKPAALGA